MSSRQRRPLGPRGGHQTHTAGGLRRTTLILDPDDMRALRRIAAERERSLSELVRQAVREFLERQPK